MPLIIELPKDVESHLREENPYLERDAKEAVALDLFRREKITLFEFGKMLGMDRFQADAFLMQRNEFAQCLTPEDLESDRATIKNVLREMGR